LRYYRVAIYLDIWPGRTQFHFGLDGDSVRSVGATMFCVLTGAECWSGRFCCFFSCGRSAAGNAAPGM
jgi:hypothetical protein